MRLLIVSNRLPVTVEETKRELRYKESAGGLATGLTAYLQSTGKTKATQADHIWVGWPGSTISDENKPDVRKNLRKNFKAAPVFLTDKQMDKYYHGFCNRTIWPLFHYFTANMVCNEGYWKSYVKVNTMFRDAVLETYREGDTIWIHDYQLMLLPQMIREKLPDAPIAFFLHIPFPGFEIFRLLPRTWKRGILEGLLGANLVGFHTHDYTQYFLRSVLRILGYEHRMGQLIAGKHIVKAGTFPLGINFKKFNETSRSAGVAAEKKRLKKTLAGYKIVLSVDRLDYTKGVVNRLEGYEAFLSKHREWHGKVVLVILVVPSRIGVDHYQQMKKGIDELVGRINGHFGTIDWTPVRYQYNFASFENLVALYNMSDVSLVTPVRDGMNLIAKEYVASRTDQTGVLILSEMAGAAKELQESIIINPTNREEIVEALKMALEMPRQEQIRRNSLMQERLQHYDVIKWANDFMKELGEVRKEQKHFNAKLLGPTSQKSIVSHYKKGKKRIVLLDYDGTLVSYVGDPQGASPTKRVLSVLKKLSEQPKTEVVIISGRDQDTLNRWLGHLNISMVCEHGAYVRRRGGNWTTLRSVSKGWKEGIRHKLETYVDRLPGSLIEEKACSLVWHYRKADPEVGQALEMELIDDLVSFTANIDLQVMQGNKIVEIRVSGVNKGAGGMYFLTDAAYDFILGVGDDWTDEDLFQVLPEEAHSIRVGITQSHAKYNVESPDDVLSLLERLVRSEK